MVAVATITYAILTWKLVSETRKMRESQTEPRISVIIQSREESINFIDMIVQNIGLGPAYNLKFEIVPDFECWEGKYLTMLGFIRNGIRYLAPNQKIQFFLTSLTEKIEKIKERFEMKVTYKNSAGKFFNDTFIIDFSEFEGRGTLGTPFIHSLCKSLEEIKKHIEYISNGFHKIKVVAYTKKELEDEMEK